MRSTRRQVTLFAVISVLLVIGVVFVRLSPSPIAPRVNVRWADGLSDAARTEVEERFRLLDGEQRDSSTWAYDLGDPGSATVQALIADPAVADTHYIDRAAGRVSPDAPRGKTTLIHSGPSVWRDSPVVRWLGLFGGSSILVSLIWLFKPTSG